MSQYKSLYELYEAKSRTSSNDHIRNANATHMGQHDHVPACSDGQHNQNCGIGIDDSVLEYYNLRRKGIIPQKPFEEWGCMERNEPNFHKAVIDCTVTTGFRSVEWNKGFTGRGISKDRLEDTSFVGPKGEISDPGRYEEYLRRENERAFRQEEEEELDPLDPGWVSNRDGVGPFNEAEDEDDVGPFDETRHDDELGPFDETKDDDDVGPLDETRDCDEVGLFRKTGDPKENETRCGHGFWNRHQIDPSGDMRNVLMEIVNQGCQSRGEALIDIEATGGVVGESGAGNDSMKKRVRESSESDDSQRMPKTRRLIRSQPNESDHSREIKNILTEIGKQAPTEQRTTRTMSEATAHFRTNTGSMRTHGKKRTRDSSKDLDDMKDMPGSKRVHLTQLTGIRGRDAGENDMAEQHKSDGTGDKTLVNNAVVYSDNAGSMISRASINDNDGSAFDSNAAIKTKVRPTYEGVHRNKKEENNADEVVVMSVTPIKVQEFEYPPGLPSRTEPTSRPWTADEEEDLRYWVQDLGVSKWTMIAWCANRSVEDCKERYRQIVVARNMKAGRDPDAGLPKYLHPVPAPAFVPAPALAPTPASTTPTMLHQALRLNDPEVSKNGGLVDATGNIIPATERELTNMLSQSHPRKSGGQKVKLTTKKRSEGTTKSKIASGTPTTDHVKTTQAGIEKRYGKGAWRYGAKRRADASRG
ncbi:hypothetical protein MMC28_004136 [Mycoblastus sanguinarius]|nr:hypothetical protein [Mycoblastus sanguinarius]